MSKLLKEISVITGSYTNADGMKKNRYTRIGSIIDTSNGPMLKLDCVPLKEGGWDGWGYLNDPKPRDEMPQKRVTRGSFDNMADDIPF